MNLEDLKKLKNSQNLSEVKKKAEEQAKSEKNSYEDERFWKPGFDNEKGTGGAIIRFLPPKPGEGVMPWQKLREYFIKGQNNKRYVETSLTSFGKADPAAEMLNRLWNSGVESDKDVYRKMKGRVVYYSNIYVIKDPHNPENEGKVFLYKYGEMIHKKIRQAVGLEDDDDDGLSDEDENILVWDFDEGANFRIKSKMKGEWINYDDSVFQNPSPLSEDEEELLDIWNRCYSLKEQFGDPAKYKTYEQLQDRLHEVLGDEVGSGVPVIEGGARQSKDDNSSKSENKSTPNKPKPEKESPQDNSDDDDDTAELDDLLESDDSDDNQTEDSGSDNDDNDDEEMDFLKDI